MPTDSQMGDQSECREHTYCMSVVFEERTVIKREV